MLILKAAGELFEEKGLKHVTFNDVAERADMCRTTIFNYFSSPGRGDFVAGSGPGGSPSASAGQWLERVAGQ